MLKNLRALREDRDLNQQVLADVLGVNQNSYSDYEREKSNIPMQSLMKLADFFGTSIDYLLGRTDECKPYPPAKKQEDN